jgi:hypothetical protein
VHDRSRCVFHFAAFTPFQAGIERTVKWALEGGFDAADYAARAAALQLRDSEGVEGESDQGTVRVVGQGAGAGVVGDKERLGAGQLERRMKGELRRPDVLGASGGTAKRWSFAADA